MNLSIRKIDVTAPYQQIPEHLDVDVTGLKLGKSIKVGQLSYEGLELATSKDVVVCSVKMTRNAVNCDTAAAELMQLKLLLLTLLLLLSKLKVKQDKGKKGSELWLSSRLSFFRLLHTAFILSFILSDNLSNGQISDMWSGQPGRRIRRHTPQHRLDGHGRILPKPSMPSGATAATAS
jgi:hypothetical protein